MAGLALEFAGDLLTDDDYKRWIEFSTYGVQYGSLKGKSWEYFCKAYVAKESERSDMAIARWRKSETQIETFEKLLYRFEIQDCIAYYYPEGEKFRQYEFIELRLTTKLIATDSLFTVEIVEYQNDKHGRKLSVISLSDKNNCLEEKTSKDGNTIVTFVYERKAVLVQYSKENARINESESKCEYIPASPGLGTYPKPKNCDLRSGLYYDFPDLRVKITLRLADSTGEGLVMRERKIEYKMLEIAHV